VSRFFPADNLTTVERKLNKYLADEYLKAQSANERSLEARRLIGRTVLIDEHTRRLGLAVMDPRDREPDDDPAE